MTSITTQNKATKIFLKIIKILVVTAFWILIWEAASRIMSRDNELMLLILPSPFTVIERWLKVAFTKPYLEAVLGSFSRIFSGFLLGTVFGGFLGILTHLSRLADMFLSPMLRVIRAVPVIAISILLFLFFESNSLPVCIVCLMVMPLIWQTVYDGLGTPDKSLLEMAKVYKLGKFKTFWFIKLPKILPALLSSAVSALGLGFKSGIAAEVISLPKKALGTTLWQSKGTVDFTEIYVVTLTVVILSLIIEFLLKGAVELAMKRGADK
jgi:NitT/TauT family transport system permease protein